jgi:hypothetical protein
LWTALSGHAARLCDLTLIDTAARLGFRAVVCFALCILAVLFGIVVIIYGKQLFGV